MTEPTLKELRAMLRTAVAARDEELGKDWEAYAADITHKLFTSFPDLKAYLDRVEKQAINRIFVISPIGRRRVLGRVLTGVKKYLGDAGRRAKNAPIQGLASEFGILAAYLTLKHADAYYRKFKLPRSAKKFYQYQRAVHDANYGMATYAAVIPMLHINQWCATYGVTEWYKEVFGLDLNIEPEIEIDVKASDDAKKCTWDWRPATLPGLIRSALEAQVELGNLPAEELEAAWQDCMRPWVDKDQREYLQATYPILGITEAEPVLWKNVNRNILDAVKAAGFTPEI